MVNKQEHNKQTKSRVKNSWNSEYSKKKTWTNGEWHFFFCKIGQFTPFLAPNRRFSSQAGPSVEDKTAARTNKPWLYLYIYIYLLSLTSIEPMAPYSDKSNFWAARPVSTCQQKFTPQQESNDMTDTATVVNHVTNSRRSRVNWIFSFEGERVRNILVQHGRQIPVISCSAIRRHSKKKMNTWKKYVNSIKP